MSPLRAVRSALALLVLVGAATATTGALAVEDELPSELAREVQDGVSFTLLAGAVVEDLPKLRALTLERLTPTPDGAAVADTVRGTELWYVEAGQLVLSDAAGQEKTYTAGEQALVTTAGELVFRIEGADCPAVLRLELTTVFLMEVGSEVSGPALDPADAAGCPPAGRLLEAGEQVTLPPAPVFAFIGRMTWAPEAIVPERTFSGPFGVAVEAGTVRVSGFAGAAFMLTAGSSFVVDGGQAHGEASTGGGPATALVTGLVGAGDRSIAGVRGTAYVSPSYGYRLAWDATWNVVAESSADGSDALQLSNGVSNVYVQAYGGFTDDAAACVASLVAQLPTRPGFTAVEPLLGDNGAPVAGSDAGRAFAACALTYTTDAGEGRYVQYLECRNLVPGEAMLVLTQMAAWEAYPDQVEPRQQLLERLTI